MSQSNRGNRKQNLGTNDIPFVRNDGSKAKISLDQVRRASDITRHHGTNPLNGVAVQSMASKPLDRSIAISVDDGFDKGKTISVPKDDAIVFAMGLLANNGFTVTAPKA